VRADVKGRIEGRIEAIRADEKKRIDKLDDAWKFTSELLRS
jgi:hypothetical protein